MTMMMKGADAQGTFYSEKGIRFGGFPTSDFFMATSDLEELRPGTQQEIIARAHWTLEWRDAVVQIAFLSVLLFSKSLLAAAAAMLACACIEVLRFCYFGSFPFIPQLSRVWSVLRYPAFVIALVLLWDKGWLLFGSALVFIIVELLGIFTSLLIPVSRIIVFQLFLRGRALANTNIEAMALNFEINTLRRQLRLGPPEKLSESGTTQY